MMVDKRIVCRSVMRVRLIIAGTSLNRGCTVMLTNVHGELLIEMEDNVYCKSNDGLFSVVVFLCSFLEYQTYAL